ncbi:MAG: fibrillarin-like rRNA/tRNA 2'-O-methyltransferase [Candidatus Bathyarchaeota archaeon]
MVVDVKVHTNFPGIYWITSEDRSKKLGTKNIASGFSVYGERRVSFNNEEYRFWDPYRSKLAAAILKGLDRVPIFPGSKVLYLGAASGTTASHISDIIGEKGQVYCIEFSSRSIRELVNNVCTHRYNMLPILADARLPESYSCMIEQIDSIYFDVAQPEQARILADNSDIFLIKGGWVMITIKAQSIDVTKEPTEVFKKEIEILESRGFNVQNVINLEPFDKAHVMVVAYKK